MRTLGSSAILLTLVVVSLAIGACRRTESGPEVVLYSSVDDVLLREIVRAYEESSGVRVRLVGDTEATKTTGLVERLLAEQGRVRADVWWSSEPFGTIRLAKEGVLAPYRSSVEDEVAWPPDLRGKRGDWYGFASRLRVIAYSTDRLPLEDVPRRLIDLTDDRWRGRVGLARPEFGTTRGHFGAMYATCGDQWLSNWVTGLRANDARVYSGNSTVVQAIAHGEIDVGLTDTDDVWNAQRNGWKVGLIYESVDPEACSHGPMLIPNTVAMVKGAPHPEEAARLIDFILSERVERLLAESDSRNLPVRESLLSLVEVPTETFATDLAQVADAISTALSIWSE